MRTAFAALFLIAIVFVSPALCQMYRWVDDKGTVTYSDTPPPGRDEVVAFDTTPAFSSSGLSKPTASGSGTALQGEPRTETRPASDTVELYVTSWCPYCRKAENFFAARNIKVRIYDIEKDREAQRRKTKLDGRKGVPLAVINGEVIYGYSEKLYLEALR